MKTYTYQISDWIFFLAFPESLEHSKIALYIFIKLIIYLISDKPRIKSRKSQTIYEYKTKVNDKNNQC